MSRSGYDDNCDGRELDLWRGAVASAIRGRRGQAFLREMLAALDALPVHQLIYGFLRSDGDEWHDGGVCALGAVGARRGMDLELLDPHDRERTAAAFGISEALTAEVEYVNDEGTWADETPKQRWERVRAWVVEQIRTEEKT